MSENAGKTRADGMPVGTPFSSENQPEGRGRPPGSRNIKTILRDLLEVPKTVRDDDGNEHEVNRLEVICAKLVTMAENGDLASIDRVFDRLEGKAAQSLNLGGQGGENPIELNSKMTVELVRPKESGNE